MLRDTKNKGNASQDPQETAAAILGWLADEPEMLGRFLALSGLQANMLRKPSAIQVFWRDSPIS